MFSLRSVGGFGRSHEDVRKTASLDTLKPVLECASHPLFHIPTIPHRDPLYIVRDGARAGRDGSKKSDPAVRRGARAATRLYLLKSAIVMRSSTSSRCPR